MKSEFTEAEVLHLQVFVELAKKAGTAALGACERALLTQGRHEARLLTGNAVEAGRFIAKREKGSVELTRGHVEALRTGAAIYLAELEKSREKDESLLVPTEHHSTIGEAAQKLAIRLKGGDLFEPGIDPVPTDADGVALDEDYSVGSSTFAFDGETFPASAVGRALEVLDKRKAEFYALTLEERNAEVEAAARRMHDRTLEDALDEAPV